MKYWEKTVEYAFLTQVIKEGKADFAAPLSGSLERGAGDAIFAEGSQFILIEFKAKKAGMASEDSKFKNYEDARRALDGSDGHHFFVYGRRKESRLELVATTYFSRRPPKGGNKSALLCLADGVEKDEFDKYLVTFLGHRESDERSKSGGVDVLDYATVIGVEPNSNSAIACSLRDYVAHFKPGNVLVAASTPAPATGQNGPRAAKGRKP